jgi:adenylate cyclase
VNGGVPLEDATRVGVSSATLRRWSRDGLIPRYYVATVVDAGLPLVAMLQLVRVCGQAMAQVADAEVRLFHLCAHEPLMRSGASAIETAEEMMGLTRELLPLASPVMEYEFERIAEVKLKGFTESTEVLIARTQEDE